jgi:hypothetical protein
MLLSLSRYTRAHYAECWYTKVHYTWVIMQNVMTFNAVVLQVTMVGPMLNVNMLKLVIVLNVGMHQVDMLSLIALMSLCRMSLW